jgi:gamma-glutamyltranspeptidase/glutathione hydrolase
MLIHDSHAQEPYIGGTVPSGGPASSLAVAERGMVATTDRLASEVGVRVLEAGGNAVDAAVATAFALAVVNPEAGNIGGGGFLLARRTDGSAAVLDFRSVAPRGATRDMFASGGAPENASLEGHLSAAVPGSVRGLWEAHGRLGSLPWAELVDPAVSLARGFVVGSRFIRSFTPDVLASLRRFPSSVNVFLPRAEMGDGSGERLPPAVGDRFEQPDLAETLARIRDRGADGFYSGETADLVLAEMARGGGLITREDLSAYRAIWREPLRFAFRHRGVLTVPPPSAGGLTLAGTALVLNELDLATGPWHSSAHLHLLAEAWRRVHVDRNPWMADPAFADVPVALLCSPAHVAARAREISSSRATPYDELEALALPTSPRVGATTHLSVVDTQGGAASLTTTINTWYGSKVVVDGAGFLLNCDMDDFTLVPGRPNYFGLVQGEANAIEPGKRMVSMMTPTIVTESGGAGDRLFAVLGSPGGSTIPTTVFQVLSNIIDYGMDVGAAVAAPRVHHQYIPDHLRAEPGALTPRVADELTHLGHRVVEATEPWGDVQAIQVGSDGGGLRLEGVSDWRRGGVALGL